jgi:hypothetical protein
VEGQPYSTLRKPPSVSHWQTLPHTDVYVDIFDHFNFYIDFLNMVLKYLSEYRKDMWYYIQNDGSSKYR